MRGPLGSSRMSGENRPLMPSFPCPACGFLTFDRPVGSFDICPICNWEDDPVQLLYPGYSGGANGESLYQKQQRWLVALMNVDLKKGFRRDPAWRPLRPEEASPHPDQPASGRGYFEAMQLEDPPYYWQRSSGPAA